MVRLIILFVFLGAYFFPLTAQNETYISDVWVADQGNGTYKNPILYADYSDPDVCRVGSDFYMTSSSFNCVPGLQILHSRDLVNWTIIGAAVPYALPPFDAAGRPEHGNRVWAPSIRHHKGEFYIFWGDPDQGVFMTKAIKPQGSWSTPVLVLPGKGIIDTCPFWDENNKVYMAHAYAGSRAGLNSVIAICELDSTATKVIAPSQIVYDGHSENPTCEGPKIYKRNGYYYIFISAGGVPVGWQAVLRSKNLFGPYDTKRVLSQGKSTINGPRQGAWVDTPKGENWYFHFQDVGAYGRVVHLQPLQWINDWPVIGVDENGDGCGEPTRRYKKPDLGNFPISVPQESDEFDKNFLSPQWQWHANINEKWAYYAGNKSFVRLYSYPVVKNYRNLWDVPNLLLQKTPSDNFVVTVKMTFSPTDVYHGERAGLIVMGLDYAGLILENTDVGIFLSQVTCLDVESGTCELVNRRVRVKENIPIYLRMEFHSDGTKIVSSKGGHDLLVMCDFAYSFDGKYFSSIGSPFKVKEGKWIGAKIGFFCTRPFISAVDGGWTDVDWFRITK